MLDNNEAMNKGINDFVNVNGHIICKDASQRTIMEQCSGLQAVSVFRSCTVDSQRGLQEYLCTGTLNENLIRYDNVREFLQICVSLKGLDALKNVCEERLIQNTNKQTIFEVFDLADLYDMPRVLKHSVHFISQCLNEISYLPEFLSLRPSQINSLVNCKRCRNKLCLRDALFNWWQHDTCSRNNVYHSLKQIVAEKLFAVDCCRKLTKHKSFLATFSFNHNAKNKAYVAANVCETVSCGEKYTANLKRGEQINKHSAVCCMQRDVTEAPYVFFSGGNCPRSSKKVLEYDVIMNKWRTCSCLKNSRSLHSMEVANDRVYVLGGKHDHKNVPQIEEYDRKKDSWKIVGQLKWAVHSCISVVCKDKIFMFGGKTENGSNVSVIQVFDSISKSVNLVGYLPVECAGGKAISIKKCVYIVTEQGHFLKFYPESNKCELLTEPPEVRQNFALFSDESGIYLIHGQSQEQKSSEHGLVYSVRNKEWSRETGSRFACFSVLGQCLIQVPNDMQHLPIFVNDK